MSSKSPPVSESQTSPSASTSHTGSTSHADGMSRPKKLMIAGGGTGGHLYPGIAIARQFQSRFRNGQVEVHFVGTERGLEARIIPKEGFHLHFVPMGMWASVSWAEKVKSLVKIPFAAWKALTILLTVKPDYVLGVGGYASAPILFMAFLLRMRRGIWEANAYPGLANRVLSWFVPTAFIVFGPSRAALKSEKILELGLPVRGAMRPQPRPAHSTLRVLVFGGSQGARGINNTVCDAILKGGDWLSGVELIHQTGRLDYSALRSKYGEDRPGLRVTDFLTEIQNEYAWADLVICRAGASTIAELSTCRKASVLIPFPFAADDHQKKNAETLANQGAAILVVQKDFSVEKFKEIICDFKANPGKIEKLEAAIAQFDRAGAAEKIVDEIIGSGGPS